jgi:putative oxidoreductase
MKKFSSFAQLYLRLAIGVSYLVFGLDRLGVFGKPGGKNISWGDWDHFMKYATEVMQFLPYSLVAAFAIIATIAEILSGLFLLIGKWTRAAAFASGILAFLYAVSMTISFGIVSSLSYSVFTLSAASFLLACLPCYPWSFDNLLKKNKDEQL